MDIWQKLEFFFVDLVRGLFHVLRRITTFGRYRAPFVREIDLQLHQAVEELQPILVRSWLESGANVNSLSNNSNSPLMLALRAAAIDFDHRTHAIETIRLLIEKGADLDYSIPLAPGYGDLRVIDQTNDLELVRLLLESGAAFDEKVASQLMARFDGSEAVRKLINEFGGQPLEWQDSIRQVYNRVAGYTGSTLYQDVLKPSTEFLQSVLEKLKKYQSYGPSEHQNMESSDSWDLYALQRLNEYLLLSFQASPSYLVPGQYSETEWRKLLLASKDEYVSFWQALGLTMREEKNFCPFFHEIVEVTTAADPESKPTITETLWPCMMFGDLMFSRAGVRVVSGSARINKDSAENSTLYWAHRRAVRPCTDLSAGWGHNSQWSTDFRRDYWCGDKLHYNVDASQFQSSDQEGGLPEWSDELVRYRCFVSHEEVDKDIWVYGWSAIDNWRNKASEA